MKKLLNTIKYIILNPVMMSALTYVGAFQDNTGFLNVLRFIIWTAFVFGLIIVTSKKACSIYYTKNKLSRYYFPTVELFFGFTIIGVLVYQGHILLGIVVLMSLFLEEFIIQCAKEYLEESKVDTQ
jgi:cytochrome c biogenesis protein CcdA